MGRRSSGQSKSKKLFLDRLNKGSLGCITASYGGYLAEAASICLEDQGHQRGVSFSIDGDYHNVFELLWGETTEQMKRCHNDLDVATEHGAYGIAVLLVHTLTDFSVIERSRKGTGFDWWLGTKGKKDTLFQNRARLEVSGIRKPDERAFRARVVTKLEQTKRSDGALPALVVIVEFGKPRSRMVKKP